jgi:hypothetical protein
MKINTENPTKSKRIHDYTFDMSDLFIGDYSGPHDLRDFLTIAIYRPRNLPRHALCRQDQLPQVLLHHHRRSPHSRAGRFPSTSSAHSRVPRSPPTNSRPPACVSLSGDKLDAFPRVSLSADELGDLRREIEP